jgi:BirA family transcriptional regulator, biotin operon repressor / biotin---[acetyl-CoA-carboxylase] ligase
MKLIKLDAIDSTNDFLKGLSKDKSTENFTVVTTLNQTHGKGQMGAKWTSENGKNLIMSVLIKDLFLNTNGIFNLNVLVAVSIIQVLETLQIPNLNIKWPNDIMAENKKIGGILIENSVKENAKVESIVGIGLNVNQINFENLPKASSLKKIMSSNFSIDFILESIVNKIQTNIKISENNETDFFWDKYHQYLFKKDKPTVFENNNNEQYMAIIKSVTRTGQLKILLEDDEIKLFGIKEISMIY